MERRALLRGLAALVTTGTFAGCTNNAEVPVTAPSGPLNIREQAPAETPAAPDDTPTESGGVTTDRSGQRFVFPPEDIETSAGTADKLVVTLVVRNRSPVRNTGLVTVTVTVGSQEYVNREFVTLDGGDETTISLTFPVSYEGYRSSSRSIQIDVTRRTPRTPVPTESPSPADSPSPTESSPTDSPTNSADSGTTSTDETDSATTDSPTTDTATTTDSSGG